MPLPIQREPEGDDANEEAGSGAVRREDRQPDVYVSEVQAIQDAEAASIQLQVCRSDMRLLWLPGAGEGFDSLGCRRGATAASRGRLGATEGAYGGRDLLPSVLGPRDTRSEEARDLLSLSRSPATGAVHPSEASRSSSETSWVVRILIPTAQCAEKTRSTGVSCIKKRVLDG